MRVLIGFDEGAPGHPLYAVKDVSDRALAAVGFAFNPSGDDRVGRIKALAAALIGEMEELRFTPAGRHAAIAITDIETAQMRAMKAAPWAPNGNSRSNGEDRPIEEAAQVAESIRKVLNGYPYAAPNPWPLDLLTEAAKALDDAGLRREEILKEVLAAIGRAPSVAEAEQRIIDLIEKIESNG